MHALSLTCQRSEIPNAQGSVQKVWQQIASVLVSSMSSGALETVADLAQQRDVFRRGGRRCRGGLFGLAQLVDLLDHDEDDEGEDHEIDSNRDEVAVRQHRHAGLLQLRQRVRHARRHRAQDHVEVREVELPEHHAHERHDDVGHERVDDLAERRPDDHADGEVDDVALDGKLLEFAEDAHDSERVLKTCC